MQKNVASQKLIVFAFDSTTNLPKTGDAANITAYESLDFGSVTVLGDTSATEMDSTNAKGYYLFDLTQGETNANAILFSAKSATSNIVVIGCPAYVQTVPAAFTLAGGASGGFLISGSNTGTTTLGAFTVTGATTLTGAVALQSTLGITGAVTLSSTLGTGAVTFGGLTTGAIAATTITASGAVAFQSTFAVTTSSAFGAMSGTTLTLSGAVAFQSTFATTGTTTFNAFTVTNNLLVSGAATVTGATTLTGAVTATNAGNSITGVTGILTAAGYNAAADAILNRDMSSGTDSGSDTVRTMRQALRAIRNKWTIAAGTLTVYKEDDATSSWTSALTGTAGVDPITASDPAGP